MSASVGFLSGERRAARRQEFASPPASTGEVWSTRVLRDDDALNRIERDWRALYGRCSGATPFQSFDWLRAWWGAYGRPGRLVVVAVRRDNRLVGGAALTLRYRFGVGTLRPLGENVSDLTDVLLDDAWAEPAAAALAEGLRRAPGSVVDLPETRPGAAAWRVRDAWPGRTWQGSAATCLELPGCLEAVLDRLPAKRRGRMRQSLRRIDRAGLSGREVCPADARAAVHRLLDLHREQWEGRPINPSHLDPRFEAHLLAAVPGMVRRGEATIVEQLHGGEVVASDLLLLGGDLVGGYLYGYRPRLRTGVPIQLLMLRAGLAVAAARAVPTFNMLRGTEEAKQRWHPRQIPNQRLLLYSGAGAAPYGWAVRTRAAAIAAARARVPWLARRARTAVRVLRGGRRALPAGHGVEVSS